MSHSEWWLQSSARSHGLAGSSLRRRKRGKQLLSSFRAPSTSALLLAGFGSLALGVPVPQYESIGCYRDADLGGGERVIPA